MDRNLVVSFLVHEDIVASLLVEELIRATLHAYVFKFLADVEAAFDNVTINNVFQLSAHESVAFTWFYVKKFDAEIQLVVHTDTSSVLNVLSVNHIFLVKF